MSTQTTAATLIEAVLREMTPVEARLRARWLTEGDDHETFEEWRERTEQPVCATCGDRGVIRVRYEATPNAPAWVLCPSCALCKCCNGRGFISDVECPKCHGTGEAA